jgi:hypothetical protein
MKRFLPILIALLGLGFIAYLLYYKVSPKEIWSYLQNADLGLMGLSLSADLGHGFPQRCPLELPPQDARVCLIPSGIPISSTWEACFGGR